MLQEMIANAFDIKSAGSLIQINVHIGNIKRETYYAKKQDKIIMDDISMLLNIRYKKVVGDMKKSANKKIEIATAIKIIRGK